MDQIPPRHEQVDEDGYQFTFYPGFVREATVQAAGSPPVLLYRQEAPYDVRGRPDEPLARSEIRLVGGPNGRNVTLVVDDPEHSIAEITVRLHPKGHTPGKGPQEGHGPDEVLIIVDETILCPPIC